MKVVVTDTRTGEQVWECPVTEVSQAQINQIAANYKEVGEREVSVEVKK